MATASRKSLASRAGAAARKVVSRTSSSSAKKPATTKSVAKAPAKKAAVKKAPAKKTAAKKTAVKAAPANKAPAKKAAVKKAPDNKAPAKKAASVKKAAAKKVTTATKVAAKKAAPVKKAAAKKVAPVTKAAPKKAPAKKVVVTKPAAKKAPVKAAATKAPATTAAPAKKATATKVATKRAASPSKLMVLDVEESWTKAELDGVRRQLADDIERLTGELVEVEGDLAGMIENSGEGAGNDQADVGSASFERDQEMVIVNNARDMLVQSEHALERIADGSYGQCEICGNAIGKNRLMAFPRAVLCLTCKQREERR
jgi:RNA polymerase-binding transcription factor DksA